MEMPDKIVLVMSLQRRVCPGCGCQKWPRTSLCRFCWVSLSREQQAGLYRPVGQGYEQALAAALEQVGTAVLGGPYWNGRKRPEDAPLPAEVPPPAAPGGGSLFGDMRPTRH